MRIIIISLFCLLNLACKEKENSMKSVDIARTYNLIIEDKEGIGINLSCLTDSNYCASKFINYVDSVNEFDFSNKNQFVKLTLLSIRNDSIQYKIELFEIENTKDTIRTTNGGTFKRVNLCEEITKTLCIMINK